MTDNDSSTGNLKRKSEDDDHQTDDNQSEVKTNLIDNNENNDENMSKKMKLTTKVNETSNQKNVSNGICKKIELNPIFDKNIDELKNFFQQTKSINSNDYCSIIDEPFKVIQLHQFIDNNESILQTILDDAKKITIEMRNNDLYSLKQSNDLKNYQSFDYLVKFFETKVKNLIENITDFKFNDKCALTFSKYDQNDYLLCHDDQLDERKIAFILYMVDEKWSEEDGGHLELFQMEPKPNDENYDPRPIQVVNRLIPKFNTLVFFEVNKKSFHQVSEIITDRYPRWSLNGWFHCTNDNKNDLNQQKFLYPQLLSDFPENDILDDDLSGHLPLWINPIYLAEEIQKDIGESFVNHSEIQLKEFLLEDKFEQLQSSFESESVKKLWVKHYQPLFFRTKRIKHENFHELPDIVKEFYLLLNSNYFYKFITKITGVDFEEEIANQNNDVSGENTDQQSTSKSSITSNHKVRASIMEWNHGDYTLSSDINPDLNECALDLDLFFNIKREPLMSTKEFGDQEIIMISDDDDDDKDEEINVGSSQEPCNGNGAIKKSTKLATSSKLISKNEPEVIELDSDDDDDDEGDKEYKTEEIEKENDSVEELENDEEEYEDDFPINTNYKGGGYISYISNDDELDENLLSIEPINNCLNIVYRNKQCQRFVKYINQRNHRVPYQHISIVFSEKN